MARRNEVDILIKAKDKASRKLRDVENQSDRLDNSLKKLAISAGAFFSAAAIGAGAAKAIKSSSDLRESVNAVNVVFAEGADTVLEFGKNSATAVGLAQSEFNQLSAVTGALLKDTGLAMTDVAERTNILAVRAADMASVMNTTVQDALSSINQALRGETEAIRRYTGDVTDASLQQFLLSQNIDKAVSKMTEQEKRLVRLSLILSQTDKFAGDFANTNKELANQQRIAAANIENAAAKLGEKLLPVITEGITLFNEFIETFTESRFDKAIKNLIELGADVSFVNQLKIQKQVNDSLERRIELVKEVGNFELKAIEHSNTNLASIREIREQAAEIKITQDEELEGLIEIAKKTKDVKDIQTLLAGVRKEQITLTTEIGKHEGGIEKLTSLQLQTKRAELKVFTNITTQAIEFIGLITEQENIEKRIKKLKDGSIENDEKRVKLAGEELKIRKEFWQLLSDSNQENLDSQEAMIAERERINGVRQKETEELDKQHALRTTSLLELEDEIDLIGEINQLTTEQILRESAAFNILNEFGPALARAVVEGENLKDVLDDILRKLSTRGLLGLVGAGLGFAVAGPTGARAGFNLGFGSPVFNAQHGDSGTFPGQGTQERIYWGIGRPGEDFNITPPGQQSRVINLTVQGGGDIITMSRGQYKTMMRDFGYEVIIEDSLDGKGL